MISVWYNVYIIRRLQKKSNSNDNNIHELIQTFNCMEIAQDRVWLNKTKIEIKVSSLKCVHYEYRYEKSYVALGTRLALV